MSGQHVPRVEKRGDASSRFYVALSISLVLHAIVLIRWTTVAPTRHDAGYSSIDVVLVRTSSPSSATMQLPDDGTHAQRPPEVLAQTLRSETPRPPPSPNQTRDSRKSLTGGVAKDRQNGTQTGDAHPAGREMRRALKAGEASALFLINEDGHIGQIYWDRLPALTDEQMRRLENSIRSRQYPRSSAGQVLSEILDVQPFLAEQGYAH